MNKPPLIETIQDSSTWQHLQKNGYCIIKGVLSNEEVDALNKRLDVLWAQEYPRNGEFGYSPQRERLLRENNKTALWTFDLLFRMVRSMVLLSMKLFSPIRQMLHQYRQRPYDYSKAGKWQIELRQMLIIIMEQSDNMEDGRVCDLVNKGAIFNNL